MNLKIAVFMKGDNKSASSTSSTTVIVFEKNNEVWDELNRHYVNIATDMDLASLRTEIRKTIDLLGDCRVAAGAQISGVLFRELDSRGFSVFEIESCSPETLDGILSDIDEALKDEPHARDVPSTPVETQTPGVYHLDLVNLQQAYPEVSSKQALRDFLDSTPFYELRLVCAHLPPWLEDGPYDISTEKTNAALIATIRKKQCQGG